MAKSRSTVIQPKLGGKGRGDFSGALAAALSAYNKPSRGRKGRGGTGVGQRQPQGGDLDFLENFSAAITQEMNRRRDRGERKEDEQEKYDRNRADQEEDYTRVRTDTLADYQTRRTDSKGDIEDARIAAEKIDTRDRERFEGDRDTTQANQKEIVKLTDRLAGKREHTTSKRMARINGRSQRLQSEVSRIETEWQNTRTEHDKYVHMVTAPESDILFRGEKGRQRRRMLLDHANSGQVAGGASYREHLNQAFRSYNSYIDEVFELTDNPVVKMALPQPIQVEEGLTAEQYPTGRTREQTQEWRMTGGMDPNGLEEMTPSQKDISMGVNALYEVQQTDMKMGFALEREAQTLYRQRNGKRLLEGEKMHSQSREMMAKMKKSHKIVVAEAAREGIARFLHASAIDPTLMEDPIKGMSTSIMSIMMGGTEGLNEDGKGLAQVYNGVMDGAVDFDTAEQMVVATNMLAASEILEDYLDTGGKADMVKEVQAYFEADPQTAFEVFGKGSDQGGIFGGNYTFDSDHTNDTAEALAESLTARLQTRFARGSHAMLKTTVMETAKKAGNTIWGQMAHAVAWAEDDANYRIQVEQALANRHFADFPDPYKDIRGAPAPGEPGPDLGQFPDYEMPPAYAAHFNAFNNAMTVWEDWPAMQGNLMAVMGEGTRKDVMAALNENPMNQMEQFATDNPDLKYLFAGYEQAVHERDSLRVQTRLRNRKAREAKGKPEEAGTPAQTQTPNEPAGTPMNPPGQGSPPPADPNASLRAASEKTGNGQPARPAQPVAQKQPTAKPESTQPAAPQTPQAPGGAPPAPAPDTTIYPFSKDY